MEVYINPRPAFMIAFATNDDLTCVGFQVPIEEFPEYRRNIEAYSDKLLDLAPDLAERVRAGKREERFCGTADLDNWFRKPYGPGWALVGDAGYHKDPINARGISDAFRDAELLANALDEGFLGRNPMDKALAAYEQQRNEAALPQYKDTCSSAAFNPIPPSAYTFRAAIRDDQELVDRFMGVQFGTVNGEEFYGSEEVQRILQAAR
jgi:flavin-dependent dehydrogenase